MPISRRSILAAALPLAALACNGPTGANAGDGGSGGSGGGGVASSPTWSEDVAPVVMKACANCHLPGGIAPFSLVTYADASPLAGAIKAAVSARTMPPENVDNTGVCNTYSDARWLTDDEIALFSAWADAGAPEGDPAKAPAPPGAPAGLTDKSLTLDMGVTYTPDPSLTDDYRCFIVDPGLASDKFLTGYQVIPGDQRVVHHLILFALDSASAEQQAEAADAADPADGYPCFGGPGALPSRFVAGWAPGGDATHFAPGTGIRLSAGRKMVMQIHYNLANGSFPDRTRADLALASNVEKEATITRVAAHGFTLPAGSDLTTVTGQVPVPGLKGPFTIWGVAPHMHTRGKTLDASYTLNGQTTCLTRVNNWNFHWQGFSSLAQPLSLPAGGTLNVTCGYDTSHDTMPVSNGEGTDDEMCIDFLYVTN